MYEVKCYDTDGSSIDSFTQWDIDQQVVITLEDCGDDDHPTINDDYISITPEVHFSNIKRDKALVVRATAANETSITAHVPNILLTEPYPLLIYVYITDSRGVSSQKTIIRTEIPVRRRDEPHDYYYVENIERITAEMIKEEIEADTEQTRTEAIDAITSTKDDAINSINSTKNSAVSTINSTKTAAETEITNTKNEAIEAIEDTKTEATTTITSTRDSAVSTINSTRDSAVSTVNTTKSEAVSTITSTRDSAVSTITSTKEEAENSIESTKNSAVSIITGIADDAVSTVTATKNEAITAINNVKDEVENDIRDMIADGSIELTATDDGNGNVTLSIVAEQL